MLPRATCFFFKRWGSCLGCFYEGSDSFEFILGGPAFWKLPWCKYFTDDCPTFTDSFSDSMVVKPWGSKWFKVDSHLSKV